MRRCLWVLLVVAVAACGGGGDAVGCPDGGCSVEETLDVAYAETDAILSRKPLLDVFAPAEEGPWPVVVVATGSGAGKAYARDWATAMASQGAVVFPVEYEVGAPQTPLDHLNCAARYVRDVAAEYGGDPSHVTLLGWSRGAQVGMVVSLGVEELPAGCLASEDAAIPDAFVGYEGLYGPGDQEFTAEELAAMGEPVASQFVGANPDLVVRLIHGGYVDTVFGDAPVAYSEEFAEILAEAGYDVEFTLVEGAAHTGVGSEDSPAFDVIVDTTLQVAGG
jgi:acetyl esterase/lipase